MNHDPYQYNPEWHERGVKDAWYTLEAVPRLTGRVLAPDPYVIARHHGADDATARELGRILANDWSGMAVLWVERLRDLDDWCTHNMAKRIKDYLNPAKLEHIISSRLRSLDPFDPETINRKAFLAACDAGGEVIMTNNATGEVGARFTLPGSRTGAASTN